VAINRSELPILILAYNRDDLFNETLKRLVRQGFKTIYINIDGPKTDEDKLKQKEMISCIEKLHISSKRVRIGEKNEGCRFGVISGITWFFKYEKMGIINEDDIEIDPCYIDRMGELLAEYEGNEMYQSICSHSEPFLRKTSDIDMGIHQSPICRVWGWATWRDRWLEHLKVISDSTNMSPLATFLSIPKEFRTYLLAMKIWTCRQGYMDAWDYDWNLSHILAGRYSLTPKGVYCINNGFRSDAMHTKSQANKPWLKTNTVTELSNSPIPYSDMKSYYKEILAKCGFSSPSNMLIELLRICAYKPYNKLIVAPIRMAKSTFKN
jgi:hypothetical protein